MQSRVVLDGQLLCFLAYGLARTLHQEDGHLLWYGPQPAAPQPALAAVQRYVFKLQILVVWAASLPCWPTSWPAPCTRRMGTSSGMALSLLHLKLLRQHLWCVSGVQTCLAWAATPCWWHMSWQRACSRMVGTHLWYDLRPAGAQAALAGKGLVVCLRDVRAAQLFHAPCRFLAQQLARSLHRETLVWHGPALIHGSSHSAAGCSWELRCMRFDSGRRLGQSPCVLTLDLSD